jgi:hypothetical protein
MGESRVLDTLHQQKTIVCEHNTRAAKKASILDLAGKYKEDPDLEQIVEDAYRRRGRPLDRGSSSSGLSN